MKYEFYETTNLFFYKWIPILSMKVLEEEYKVLNSLCSLLWEYVRKIVKKMEEVRDGELNVYNFWPEDSIVVHVAWPSHEVEEYRERALLTKAFSDFEMEIPYDDIYKLMKDYLTEIDKWEKKTGREKPGW